MKNDRTLPQNAPQDELITEEWLKSVGFRWQEVERSGKHWTLWLAQPDGFTSFEDLGIELCEWTGLEPSWHCWFRSDCSHKYSRFIHLRHLKFRLEVEIMVAALTGMKWNPENHLYGSVRTPEDAARIRAETDRLDRRIMHSNKWAKHESDPSAARPEKLYD